MADIKVIKFDGRYKNEHDPAEDSVQFVSFKTATKELTDAKLTNLIDGAEANDEHIHDSRYFAQTSFIDASLGAASEGAPIILDEDGLLDHSFFDFTAFGQQLSHSDLQDLGADDHTQYIRVDGTRAFTGNQSMGSFKLTNVLDPENAQDAATKAYVDSVAVGLRPKGDVEAATTANIDLASMPADIDGHTLAVGERFLAKDQTDATQNGIYVFNGVGVAATRSEDQDNAPLAEIVNGVWIPVVLNGTTNQGTSWFISSQGTGVDGQHVIGTDDIVWDLFTSPTQLTAGDGIDFSANVVSVDFLANGGLKFVGDQLAVEPDHFAGEGLIDDGSDNLAIDWSTTFDDAKAVKAEDLSSNATGFGASIIGIEDADNYYTATDVEGAFKEIYEFAKTSGGIEYVAGAGGVSAGDLVYVSANNTVLPYDDITVSENVVGMAEETASAGNPVIVVRFDKLIEGVISAATAGQEFYWDGTTLTTVIPSGANEHVYLVGVAKNATDLSVEVRHLYRVS